MKTRFTIVDGHAHTFLSDEVASKIIEAFNRIYTIEFDNPGKGTIDDLLLTMEENNTDFTVMANFASPKFLHTNNEWSLRMSKEHPCLVPLVSFHPDMEGNLVEILEKYVENGAKGIKIHPMAQGFMPDHEKLMEVYQYCNQIALPVVFHCGRVANARINEYADLDRIMPIIEKYGQLPVILTHMADGNREDVLRLSRSYEHVYFDTSIVISGYPPIIGTNEPSWPNDNEVVEIINEIGISRVMFGSDYPWGSPKHDIERLIRMDFSEHQKELLLGKNALCVYGIGKD
ncbi:MAG: amidohydrolase family protein [Clostridia bacterium]|nr:amidohydrolase family protein [Clostridia bacterium]